MLSDCHMNNFLKILIYFLTLQYCVGFAIYQHESATGIYVFPILNPPPSSLPVPSLWVVPVYQPHASSIMHLNNFLNFSDSHVLKIWASYLSLELWEHSCQYLATHSSILARRISWTEEPGGLQSMGSQKSWT